MVGEPPPPRLALGLPRRVPHVPGFLGGASITWEKDDHTITMCGFTFPFTLNGGFQIWDQFIPMMLGFRTHAADTGG